MKRRRTWLLFALAFACHRDSEPEGYPPVDQAAAGGIVGMSTTGGPSSVGAGGDDGLPPGAGGSDGVGGADFIGAGGSNFIGAGGSDFVGPGGGPGFFPGAGGT
jgi:hypothetical protein